MTCPSPCDSTRQSPESSFTPGVLESSDAAWSGCPFPRGTGPRWPAFGSSWTACRGSSHPIRSASVAGPARVLGVDVVARTHPDPADTAGADLAARRRALVAELSAVADKDDAEQARRGFLDVAARTGAAALARSWASTTGAGEGLAAAEDLLAARIGEVHARRRALAERRAELERHIAALDRTIEARQAPRTPDTRTVVVDLDADATADADAIVADTVADTDGEAGPDAGAAAEGIEVELEVSYLVPTAGWRAGYDARLDGERVTLTWFALIAQRSGEDWPATADLVLSTARPAAHAELPELTPQFVDLRQPPPPPPPAAAPAVMATAGAMPLGRGRAKAKGVKVARAGEPEIDFVGAATYRPPRRAAVPADGGRHRVTVAVIEFDAALDHLTVPRTSPDAYLRATVTNTSPHTLLPGKVSIFHGGDFAGSGTIGMVPPGAEVELNLGVDHRVRVERELVRRATGRRVGGEQPTGRGRLPRRGDQPHTSADSDGGARPDPGLPARKRHCAGLPGAPRTGRADRRRPAVVDARARSGRDRAGGVLVPAGASSRNGAHRLAGLNRSTRLNRPTRLGPLSGSCPPGPAAGGSRRSRRSRHGRR